MTIKNGDMPAMPFVDGGFGQYAPQVFGGLTKLEHFASLAPEMPSWFKGKNAKDIFDNGEEAIFFKWRWYYAEMMTNGEQR